MARRPLESEHGDPFTLLNAYDEWIQVRGMFSSVLLRRLTFAHQVKTDTGGSSTYRWCKSRGIEQQRFYEITKLKEQFQAILEVSRPSV